MRIATRASMSTLILCLGFTHLGSPCGCSRSCFGSDGNPGGYALTCSMIAPNTPPLGIIIHVDIRIITRGSLPLPCALVVHRARAVPRTC